MKVQGTYTIENGIMSTTYSAEVSILGIKAKVKDAEVSVDINQVISNLFESQSNPMGALNTLLNEYGKILGINDTNLAKIKEMTGITLEDMAS